MTDIGKVYYTSRKMEKGWVYKYKGKESIIYKEREDAENAMLLEILKPNRNGVISNLT